MITQNQDQNGNPLLSMYNLTINDSLYSFDMDSLKTRLGTRSKTRNSFKTGVRFEKFRIANLLPIKVRKIESHCSKTITISNLTEEVFLRLEIICAVRVSSWKSLC